MSPLLAQLREWRIAVRLAGDSIRYVSATPPPPERIQWIAEHKAELVAILRTQAEVPAVPLSPKSAVDEWLAPPAFLPTGEPNPDLWPALAERLILEAPEASRKPLRDLVGKRTQFWSGCIEAADVARMVYVDLETEVAEKYRRRLAVWFGGAGGCVQAEGMSTESNRPVEAVAKKKTPTPEAANFGSLFVGVR